MKGSRIQGGRYRTINDYDPYFLISSVYVDTIEKLLIYLPYANNLSRTLC